MKIRIKFVFPSLLFIILLTMSNLSLAQIVTGKVVDDKGKIMQGVAVTINDSVSLTTNTKGTFNTLALRSAKPRKVKATKKGYRVKTWDFVGTEIQVVMYSAPNVLTGKVLGSTAQAVRNIAVSIAGESEIPPTFTNANGDFVLNLPPHIEPTEDTKFDIDGTTVTKESYTFDKNKDYYVIKTTISHGGSDSNGANLNADGTPQLFNITVLYQEDYSPVEGLRLKVDGKEFVTDKQGKFQVVTVQMHVSKFKIEEYDITKFNVDAEGNYVFLIIRTKAAGIENDEPVVPMEEKLDSMILDYNADFKKVINQLEFKKQFLFEKGTMIRSEMEEIAQKLRNEKSISPQQRKALKVYLRNLEYALIENDSTFERLQDQSNMVVEELREIIFKQQEQIEVDVEQQRTLEIELYIAIIAGFILLGVVIAFFFLYKRLRKQKEEIQHAYNNIKNISSIGQKVTSTLDFRTMVQTANSNMASLIHSAFFGVGIFDEAEQRIEFLDFVKKGETQQDHFEYMEEEDKLSIWCFQNNKPVTINNIEMQYKDYLSKPIKIDANTPQSLIYLPLAFENKVLGVITAQSLEKNAFNEIDLKMMQTLASYVSVALSNANAYEVINIKNKNITDSIRYAQTIQEAIMPSESQMHAYFSEYFVIYRPKDIVSGDIYWLGHNPIIDNNRSLVSFALIDCTGHGVPGGFMSLVSSYLLNDIESNLTNMQKKKQDNSSAIFTPAVVLEYLDGRFRESLKQYEKNNDDGMDIAFCTLEQMIDGQTKVTFAGAKRPILYYRQADAVLETIRGEKRSIGGQYKKEHPFQNHEIILSKGDMLYFTTDGFADQNDEERHRFTSAKLTELIEENAKLPTKEQKANIETILDSYMKNTEQRDDITIIGIRV
ncbi:MAG: GAF domain-containing protein [Cytophagales bacterium]|nr:MAG: GAF domain-containing protein [Cytophagales bacterium]